MPPTVKKEALEVFFNNQKQYLEERDNFKICKNAFVNIRFKNDNIDLIDSFMNNIISEKLINWTTVKA